MLLTVHDELLIEADAAVVAHVAFCVVLVLAGCKSSPEESAPEQVPAPVASAPITTRPVLVSPSPATSAAAASTQVLSASAESTQDAENAAFVEKYGFPYPLLSDADQAIARAYGAHDPGQPYPRRNTYVIAGDGTFEQVLEAVNPKTHPRALLDSLGG